MINDRKYRIHTELAEIEAMDGRTRLFTIQGLNAEKMQCVSDWQGESRPAVHSSAAALKAGREKGEHRLRLAAIKGNIRRTPRAAVFPQGGNLDAGLQVRMARRHHPP